MVIRPLPVERLGELNEIYDMSQIENFQHIRRGNLESCKEICFVAEEDGRFVGEVSIMTENANIPAAVIPNKRMYFFGLRVLPDFRRKGIGTALMTCAISQCLKRGIFEFTIGVESDNADAKRLYERLGFKPFLENCSEVQFGKVCRFDLLMLKCNVR
ncbi:MAG: GNAT family N-acetyltransferase [Ruminococcaceae bacterium]|nr:GNAT family N-acetyltransferase [Oscillospiraceae bacterium]